MPVINISVENKIAEADGTLYVCGNSDFVAKFAFDAEWEAYETKTARFGYNNSYVDVVFTGNKCPVPIISGTYFFNIGVYAGNLHTTTPARVPCKKSILCDTGFPADPPNDIYNQIMAKLNSLESADPEAIAKAVANYLAEHPVEETDPTVPEWAKAEITGAKVGQIVKIAAVDASGKPTAWSPVDMPGGGGGDGSDETFELIKYIKTAEAVNEISINADDSGEPFELEKVQIYTHLYTKDDVLASVRIGLHSSINGGTANYNWPFIAVSAKVKSNTAARYPAVCAGYFKQKGYTINNKKYWVADMWGASTAGTPSTAGAVNRVDFLNDGAYETHVMDAVRCVMINANNGAVQIGANSEIWIFGKRGTVT